jgi:lysophospholipase L1-like esterase
MKAEVVFGKRGSLRRRTVAAAYALLATAAVLAAVELLARRSNGFGYRRAASPAIVYELRPEYHDHNSTGHRDHEYGRAKRPGVFRVIGIGDSYTYGAGVAREDVFLKVAERLLAADGARVEVLNFGVPGYNTAMEAAVLQERTPEWDPDLVVIQFCRNDFNLPNFVWTTGNSLVARSFALHELLSGLAVRWPAFVKKDAMGYFFDEEVFPVPGLEHVAKKGHNPIGDPALAPERYHYMLGPDGVRAALARIAAESRRRGVPVIFLLGWAGRDQDAAEWATVEGIEVLDVWPPVAIRFVLAGGGFQDLWVAPERGDNHPNVEGHAIIGAALAEAIRPHLR